MEMVPEYSTVLLSSWSKLYCSLDSDLLVFCGIKLPLFIFQVKDCVSGRIRVENNSVMYGNDAGTFPEYVSEVMTTLLELYLEDTQGDWNDYLPAITYGMNTAVHPHTGNTPCALMFSRSPNDPAAETQVVCKKNMDEVTCSTKEYFLSHVSAVVAKDKQVIVPTEYLPAE